MNEKNKPYLMQNIAALQIRDTEALERIAKALETIAKCMLLE